MSQYYRIRAYHGTYLAVYQLNGTICAVADNKMGAEFQPVFLYRGEILEEGTGVLLGEAPETGFFIRPYPFGNRAIPIHIRDGFEPGFVSFVHPGTRFYTVVHPPQVTDHFSLVIANRGQCKAWESFTLEPQPDSAVPAQLRALVGTIPALSLPKRSAIDLYSRFGCDALASRADAPPIATIMAAFDSLGDNCEFGFAQRRCHAEPLGLLRFGGGLGISGVAAALRERFERIGQKENMVCKRHAIHDKEYNVTDRAYNLGYHTWRDIANLDPGIVIEEESKKLKYLKNKIIEDLEDCAKIFVFKKNTTIEDKQIRDLLDVLRRFGNNTLLSVVMSDEDHPAGTVSPIMDGLLRGYTNKFAPYEAAFDISVPAWIRICRNAYALWR